MPQDMRQRIKISGTIPGSTGATLDDYEKVRQRMAVDDPGITQKAPDLAGGPMGNDYEQMMLRDYLQNKAQPSAGASLRQATMLADAGETFGRALSGTAYNPDTYQRFFKEADRKDIAQGKEKQEKLKLLQYLQTRKDGREKFMWEKHNDELMNELKLYEADLKAQGFEHQKVMDLLMQKWKDRKLEFEKELADFNKKTAKTKNMEELIVPMPGGGYELALTKDDAKKAKNANAAYEDLITKIDEMINLRKRYNDTFIPGEMYDQNAVEIAESLGSTVATTLKGKEFADLGVIAGPDLELIAKQIPLNPLEMEFIGAAIGQDPTMVALEQAKKNLQTKWKSGLRTRLQKGIEATDKYPDFTVNSPRARTPGSINQESEIPGGITQEAVAKGEEAGRVAGQQRKQMTMVKPEEVDRFMKNHNDANPDNPIDKLKARRILEKRKAKRGN